VKVTLTTDGWPLETSWDITGPSPDGTIATGSYVDKDTTHVDYACIVTSKCYTFTIKDSYGDGFLGIGAYAVEVNGVNVNALGGAFTFEGECDTISGIIRIAHATRTDYSISFEL